MGALSVFLLRYGKVVFAWSILVAAAAVFYNSIENSAAFDNIAELQAEVLSRLADVSSAIPSRVSDVNQAIHDSLDDSNGLAQLLFWLVGFDVLESILTYVIAQLSAIISAVVFVGSSALVFAGFLWAIRRTQRFIRAVTGGDLNVDVVD